MCGYIIPATGEHIRLLLGLDFTIVFLPDTFFKCTLVNTGTTYRVLPKGISDQDLADRLRDPLGLKKKNFAPTETILRLQKVLKHSTAPQNSCPLLPLRASSRRVSPWWKSWKNFIPIVDLMGCKSPTSTIRGWGVYK